jgi:hypothetical protein
MDIQGHAIHRAVRVEKSTCREMPGFPEDYIYDRLERILGSLKTNAVYCALNKEANELHHKIQKDSMLIDEYEKKCSEAQEIIETLIYEQAFKDGFKARKLLMPECPCPTKCPTDFLNRI